MKVGDKVTIWGGGSTEYTVWSAPTFKSREYFLIERQGITERKLFHVAELVPVEPDRFLFQVGDAVVYRYNLSSRVFLVSQLHHQDGVEYMICKPQDRGGPVLFQADSMKLA